MFPKSSYIREKARVALSGVWGKVIGREMLISLTSVFFSFPAMIFDIIAILFIGIRIAISIDPSSLVSPYNLRTILILSIHLAVSLVFMSLSCGMKLSTNHYYVELAKHPDTEPEIGVFEHLKLFSTQFFLDAQIQILTAVMTLFLIIPGVLTAIKYSLSQYVLAEEPTTRPGDAMAEAGQLIDGYKGKFFMFTLSYLPWFLLGVLTFGIGLLWVVPYYKMGCAKFCEMIKNPKWEHVQDEDEMASLQSEHFSYKEFLNEYDQKRNKK